MSYHTTTKHALHKAPNTLGVQLGRIAVRKGISVVYIASNTGATRATVYNWFSGREVTNAYKRAVENLIATLSAT
jgi:hypothetical protein